MAFNISPLPSGGAFFYGTLLQTRFASLVTKRSVLLCIPSDIFDVQAIAAEVALRESLPHPGEPVTSAQIDSAIKDNWTITGHIALSAISGYPLLIIGTKIKTFVHFSTINQLLDEHDLRQVCTFAIKSGNHEYRFVAETSTDYQYWVGAISDSFAKMKARHNKFRPSIDSPSILATSLSLANLSSTASSAIERNPPFKHRLSRSSESYLESHRNIEKYSQDMKRQSYESGAIRTRRYSTEIHNTVNPEYKKKNINFGFKSNVSKLLAKIKSTLFKCMKSSRK